MTLRYRITIAALVGIGCSHTLAAEEPSKLGVPPDRPAVQSVRSSSANQQIANGIADQLRQSTRLRHYNVDVAFANGTASVTGSVLDSLQREEVLRVVKGVPGVDQVVDRLCVDTMVRQTQAVAPPQQEPAPVPRKAMEPAVGGSTEPLPMMGGGAPSGGGSYDVNAPHMPPYAWPSYAPYNNFSRVAYPQLYPYNAWPYIGPCYPFPKVPLSWRKISLEWQDGHWWYGTNTNSHDWWRLRYW